MANSGQKRTLKWEELTPEQRALELWKRYLDPEYDAEPGQLFDDEDGQGSVWRQLTVSNIDQLGVEISGLSAHAVKYANTLLREWGYRIAKRHSVNSTHYIRVEPPAGPSPQTTQEPGTPEVNSDVVQQVVEALAHAAQTIEEYEDTIAQQTAEIERLKKKLAAAQAAVSGDAAKALTAGLRRLREVTRRSTDTA